MSSLRKALGIKLRARPGELTQKEFARIIGINQASMNRIELGEQDVTIDTLQLICDRLKCHAGDLLDDLS